jgi:hypothetical protein
MQAALWRLDYLLRQNGERLPLILRRAESNDELDANFEIQNFLESGVISAKRSPGFGFLHGVSVLTSVRCVRGC